MLSASEVPHSNTSSCSIWKILDTVSGSFLQAHSVGKHKCTKHAFLIGPSKVLSYAVFSLTTN